MRPWRSLSPFAIVTRTRVAIGHARSASKPIMRGVRKRKRPGSAGSIEKCARTAVSSGDSRRSSGIRSSLKRTRICASVPTSPTGATDAIGAPGEGDGSGETTASGAFFGGAFWLQPVAKRAAAVAAKTKARRASVRTFARFVQCEVLPCRVPSARSR